MKTTLKRLSLCDCGFSVLSEAIPLGTEYEIDPAQTEALTFICGGCHKIHFVRCVWVEKRGTSAGGFLPEIIFQEPK